MTDGQTLVVFRASAAEAVLVDRAASRLGVSKSRFLRLAITKRVEEVMAMAVEAHDSRSIDVRSDSHRP